MGYNLKWFDGTRRKLTPEVVADIKACGFMFKTIEESCRYCGISSVTYRSWRKDADEELEEKGYIEDDLLCKFYDAHDRGRQERIDGIAHYVLDEAELDADLGLKVLERHSKQWSNKVEQKIEVTQKQEIKIDASSMTDDQIEEQLKRIALNKESEGE